MKVARQISVVLVAVVCAAMAWAQAETGQKMHGEKMGGMNPEERIAREVRHEILMLPYYSLFDEIGFQVNGGTVTLTGAVTRPTLKSDSENRVKKIEGVEKVINNIEVLPPSSNDDQIRLAMARAIYGHPALSKYAWGVNPPIHIVVNRGRARLVGVVDNETDKNIAEIQAKSVPGVFEVKNELQVANQKPA